MGMKRMTELLLPLLLGFGLVLGGLFLLSGCKFTELVFYEHAPSKKFYQEYDITDPDLKPYINDGVLFVTALKAVVQREEYIIWQGLYSAIQGKQVTIKKAVIEGNAWHQEVDLDETLTLDEKIDKAELFRASIKLFQIEGELLENASSKDGSLRLKVFYENEGRRGVIEYELQRRVEKYNVYPT